MTSALSDLKETIAMLRIPALVILSAVASHPLSAQTPAEWRGAYLGLQAGASGTDIGYSFVSEGVPSTFDHHDTATPYGGHAGLLIPYRRFVFGSELAYLRPQFSHEGIDTQLKLLPTRSAEIDHMLLVTGRAGVPLGPVFPYVKTGFALMHMKLGGYNPSTDGRATVGEWQPGLAWGAGFDWKLSPSLSVGFDWTRIGVDFTGEIGSPTNQSKFWKDLHGEVDLFMGRLNLHLR
jgi:opacity protein-like surface antigen